MKQKTDKVELYPICYNIAIFRNMKQYFTNDRNDNPFGKKFFVYRLNN